MKPSRLDGRTAARSAPRRGRWAAIAIGMALLATGPAAADRRRDQDAAYDQTRSGEIRPLREIEDRFVGRMGGATYLGPEFDPSSAVYRLKFMRSGQVIWVDVDARTGREIGRSGR